jgi:hypothetical protein
VRNLRGLLRLGALALTIPGCMSSTSKPPVDFSVVPCGKQSPLQVVELRFFPDPIPEARPISQWRALIRSDSTEACRTTVQVTEKDKDQTTSVEYTVYLSSGTNEILLDSAEQYRLSGDERCFQVVATIDGTKSPIAAKQHFCARTIDKAVWSMR